MKATNAQIKRTEAHWGGLAGEEVDVEVVDSTIYGFGTEAGVRRLADRLHAGRVGYAANLDCWFFTPNG